MRTEFFLPDSALEKPPARRIRLISLLVHAAFILLVTLGSFRSEITKVEPEPEGMVTELAPYKVVYPVSSKPAGGGGGGGERSPVPATRGKLPRFSIKPLTPPRLPKDRSKLQAEPELLGHPEIIIQSPPLPNYGDPLAGIITKSQGPGVGSGFGTGEGGGVGEGSGPGVGPGKGGGYGGGVYRAGYGGVSELICLYCPSPEFSDEAMKDRQAGPVVLRIVVDETGKVVSVEVVKKLGYGLDERAVETVRRWRFKPAEKDGKPVAAWVLVEVIFRQL